MGLWSYGLAMTALAVTGVLGLGAALLLPTDPARDAVAGGSPT